MEHGSRKSIKTLIDYLVHPFFRVILGIRSRLRMIILGDKTLKIVQNGFKVFMLFWVIDSMEVVYYDCSWSLFKVHQSFSPFLFFENKMTWHFYTYNHYLSSSQIPLSSKSITYSPWYSFYSSKNKKNILLKGIYHWKYDTKLLYE